MLAIENMQNIRTMNHNIIIIFFFIIIIIIVVGWLIASVCGYSLLTGSTADHARCANQARWILKGRLPSSSLRNCRPSAVLSVMFKSGNRGVCAC